MKLRRVFVATILLGISLSNFASIGSGQTAKLPAGVTKINSIEGISEYRLENGLQILLIPDQTKQNATVNIVYRVGSRHEGYGETGMAHLLEHLVFKGTPKYANIPGEMSKRGMAPNGTTSYDRTNYYATFPATGDNLEFYLDMEADRMVNSFIAKKDLDSEMTVVRNEMESGENTASRVLVQRVFASAYTWHNYGKATIGARSDVENVRIENLQAFYRKYYQPDNTTLIVGGKFDEAATLEMIGKKYGSIPKPTRILEPTWTTDPAQDGERTVTIRRVGDEQFVVVGYHIPSAADPDFLPVAIAERILIDQPAGRLYKSLVETKKAVAILSGAFQQKEPGYVLVGVRLNKQQSMEEAERIIVDSVETLASQPPTAAEIERQKTLLLNQFERTINDANTVANVLTDWVARGDWRLYLLHRERLKKVTSEDVQRAAKNYFIQSNRTVGRFIPTDKPERVNIQRLTDQQIGSIANEVKAGEKVAEGETFDATPANIEARTRRGQIGSMKTAFLPKDTRGDLVVARLELPYGDEKSLMNTSSISAITGALLMRGTKNRTRQQLADDMSRLKATIGVNGSPVGATASISAKRETLADALRLVEEVLKDPAFTSEDFERVKLEAISNTQNGRSEPQSIATREMRIATNTKKKGEVGYVGTLDEEIADLKAVTLEDVKKFHRDFYGASAGRLSIVGDFNEQEIALVVKELFGGWKSAKLYRRISDPHREIKPANKVFETPDKANAVFLSLININLRDDRPDYPAMLLGNYMLGGGFLNSRLATRIRQKDGLSYSVGSALSIGSYDDAGTLFIQAIFAPENAARLETAVREELTKVITEGFTEKEVLEAKQGWVLARQRNRSNDSTLRTTLTNYLELGRTFAWDDELEKKVLALTVGEINTSVKKYLDPNKFTTVKAGDFAKLKAAAKP